MYVRVIFKPEAMEMKKLEFIFVIGLAVYLMISGLDIEGFSKDYNDLQNDVVRIHILANSDRENDQTLKLSVRDRILEHTNGWLSGCEDKNSAVEVISSRIDEINGIAQQMVYECGYDYQTKTEVVEMEFDDRVYGDITMPRGSYTALRVTIGEAQGHNWWCVMYPPLCIPASGGSLDIDDYDMYFTEGEIDIMKNCNDYEIKFRISEIYDFVKSLFSEQVK